MAMSQKKVNMSKSDQFFFQSLTNILIIFIVMGRKAKTAMGFWLQVVKPMSSHSSKLI